MNDRVAVIGIGWAGFRPVSPESSYKELMYEAAVKAYDDAGIDPRRDVDSFITVAEDFIEGTSIFDEYVPDQLGAVLKPVHTIGGDGLHGIATGVMLIKTGQAKIVVVEGHSKLSNVLTLPHIVAYAQDPILNRPLEFETDFIAGLEMNRYLFESGTTLEQCAMVAIKNRRNALRNPLAAFGADLTLDEAMGGDPIAWPLLDRHTARHADGAVVLVLANEETAQSLSPLPVWVTGVGWCNGAASLESRDWGHIPYVRAAAEMAYRQAGIGQPRLDLDFVEIDDIYAYKELQTLEALGICSLGEAGPLTEEGGTESFGEFPVNTSGGSLGVGDMMDANGMTRALEVVLQLRGEAGMHQLEDVQIGLAQSWRGVPTTSTAVAIFQA